MEWGATKSNIYFLGTMAKVIINCYNLIMALWPVLIIVYLRILRLNIAHNATFICA